MKHLLAVFASWRMFLIVLLGFSSGLPLALTSSTLQAWMASEKVDLTVIGLFSLVGLPYTFKFLWSPILDRYEIPFLGRRRGWMFLFQIALVIGIVLLGSFNPVENPMAIAVLCLFVAFSSASQDIVVDAWRIESLSSEELGAAAGVHILGYRVAMIVSGALALMLADQIPWRSVYWIMAACGSVGILATLLAPEPVNSAKRPTSLSEALIDPIVAFFKRRGVFEILLFIIIYKLDVALTNALATPFLLELGFTKTEIGWVNKVFGMIATIVGTLAGGAFMVRQGMQRSLWSFGIIQALAGGSFMLLANFGKSTGLLIAAVAIENFCSGLGTAAFAAFMMRLCDRRFTATQYALLTSFMAVARYLASAPSGYFVKALGWSNYYLVCILAGIPGLLLLTRYKHWNVEGDNTNSPT